MKKMLTFLLFLQFIGFCQGSIVTFQNHQFYIDGKPFFPIGWYEAFPPRSDGEIGKLNTSWKTTDLEFSRRRYLGNSDKANTILVSMTGTLYNYSGPLKNDTGEIICYPGTGVPVPDTVDFAPKFPQNYISALKLLLPLANSYNIKVIVELPLREKWSKNRISHTAIAQIIDSIKFEPALFAYYHCDEIDEVDSSCTIVDGSYENRMSPNFPKFMRDRYNTIKTHDPNHPAIIGAVNKAHVSNDYKDKIYDVIFADSYPFVVGTSYPSAANYNTRRSIQDLDIQFYNENQNYPSNYLLPKADYYYFTSGKNLSNESAMLFVAQGHDIKKEETLSPRLPSPIEVQYSIFSPIYWGQTNQIDYVGSENSDLTNLGGLMFWWHDPNWSSAICQDRINENINFFVTNRLNDVVMQKKIDAVETYWPVFCMYRHYNNNYYLITLNESIDLTSDYTIKIKNFGSPVSYKELNLPETEEFYESVSFTQVNDLDHIFVTSWKPWQTRIFLISPKITGPSLLNSANTTYTWLATSGGTSYMWYKSTNNSNWSSLNCTSRSYSETTGSMGSSHFWLKAIITRSFNNVQVTDTVFTERIDKSINVGGLDKSNSEIKTEKENILPKEYMLFQNHPNPFNPSTRISYSIPENDFVSVKVFNTLGQEISTLVNEVVDAGTHSIDFDGSSLPSGMYIYQIQTSKMSQVKKMLLVK